MSSPTGRVGRFELVRELGAGGFGTVYEGIDPATSARVAVKVLDRMGVGADVVRLQLLAEADALRSVVSPHTLRVVEVVDEGSVLALVTDYVEAAPLRSVLDEHGRLSGQDALTVLFGAAQGLAAVHAAGLVHGDVKPANILIEPSGNSKLIDFGLASLPGWISEDSASPWGSPAYAPPEQVAHEYRDHRSDIYSLTVTLYEVLCGQRPFAGDTIERVRQQHVYEPLPDPRTFVPDLGDGLTQLLMWGLAKDPDDRPQDVATWLQYLHAAAEQKYGPGWATAGSVGAIAGGLVASGMLATGVLAGSLGTSAAAGAATGTASAAATAGTVTKAGFLTTGVGKAVAGVAVAGTIAAGGVGIKAFYDHQRVEQIAFARCDTPQGPCQIFTINRDGTGEKAVGSAGNIGARPAWSSDGAKLAYFSSSETTVVNLDGSDPTTFEAMLPSWSPDRTQVAFMRIAAADASVYIAKPDGSKRQKIGTGIRPVWSPDGTEILYSGEKGLVVTNVASRSSRTVYPADELIFYYAWSPDGSKIAAVTDCSGDASCKDGNLRVIGADGKGKRSIHSGDGNHIGEPAWSPDGSKIALCADPRILVMDADGKGKRTVAKKNGACDVSWAPSGDMLSFTQFADPAPRIWLVNEDGSDLRVLTKGSWASWGSVPRRNLPSEPEPTNHEVTAQGAIADRRAVVKLASEFAVTFNTYSTADKAGYQRNVKPLMTPEYYREFLKLTSALFAALEGKNQSSGDAKVLSVALDAVDADSALALVAVNTVVRTADSAEPIPRRFRWEVSMSKVGDEWLVSNFEPVSTEAGSIGDPLDEDSAEVDDSGDTEPEDPPAPAVEGDARARAAEDAADEAAEAAEIIFSYRYDRLAEHQDAAREVMTPKYAKKFAETSSSLGALARERKIHVTAVVRASAPVECGEQCSPGKVTVLVFIDQARIAEGADRPAVFGNRIEMSMVERNKTWLVDDIKAL